MEAPAAVDCSVASESAGAPDELPHPTSIAAANATDKKIDNSLFLICYSPFLKLAANHSIKNFSHSFFLCHLQD
jgi:hypothetical protein